MKFHFLPIDVLSSSVKFQFLPIGVLSSYVKFQFLPIGVLSSSVKFQFLSVDVLRSSVKLPVPTGRCPQQLWEVPLPTDRCPQQLCALCSSSVAVPKKNGGVNEIHFNIGKWEEIIYWKYIAAELKHFSWLFSLSYHYGVGLSWCRFRMSSFPYQTSSFPNFILQYTPV